MPCNLKSPLASFDPDRKKESIGENNGFIRKCSGKHQAKST